MGANLPFNFLLLQSAWTPQAVAQIISEYMTSLPLGAWPNWVLGNHDNPRIATRVGVAQAPIAAMLLLTLPGTLTLYYGEEIGMTNVSIPPQQVRDPAEIRQPGIGMGRDPERTPMPWDGSQLAGFTTGQPWLPLGDHLTANVEAQQADATSTLNMYRKLIAIRREHPTLVDGALHAVTATGNLLTYERVADDERLLILLNFGDTLIQVPTPPGIVIASTNSHRNAEHTNTTLNLHPSQGLIIKLTDSRPELPFASR
jgi:alpha-glucosidase